MSGSAAHNLTYEGQDRLRAQRYETSVVWLRLKRRGMMEPMCVKLALILPDNEAPSYKDPYSNPVPLAQMEVKTAAWVRVENSTPGQAVQRRSG
jgi:hypothetical protein